MLYYVSFWQGLAVDTNYLSTCQIANDHRVRIAYLGRMLKLSEPLLEQGWQEGHLVNALVVPRQLS